MKLLLDEMMPPAIAEQLRRRGIDAIAATDREHVARYGNTPDEIVFARAQEDKALPADAEPLDRREYLRPAPIDHD